jgi:hypothetical protein
MHGIYNTHMEFFDLINGIEINHLNMINCNYNVTLVRWQY